MAQSRKRYRLLHVLAALGTITATTIFCLLMLPSGCISHRTLWWRLRCAPVSIRLRNH
jgi:hypothetical protein